VHSLRITPSALAVVKTEQPGRAEYDRLATDAAADLWRPERWFWCATRTEAIFLTYRETRRRALLAARVPFAFSFMM
jgi:hypothetical protein